jgi:hypothetical protein
MSSRFPGDASGLQQHIVNLRSILQQHETHDGQIYARYLSFHKLQNKYEPTNQEEHNIELLCRKITLTITN